MLKFFIKTKKTFSSTHMMVDSVDHYSKDAISILNKNYSEVDKISDFYSKLWTKCDYSLQIKLPNVIGEKNVNLFFSRFKYIHQVAVGGFRMNSSATQEINDSLAKLYNFQAFLFDFPYVGASTSIQHTPVSKKEHAELIKSSVIELCRSGHMNPNSFIPGVDLGTDRNTMGFISQFYNSFFLQNEKSLKGCTTNKPMSLGGTHGSENAMGTGIAYILNHYLNNLEILKKHKMIPGISEKNVIIQGFGESGQSAAKVLYAQGANIIGIAEKDGGIFNPNGIKISEFVTFFENSKAEGNVNLADFKGAKFLAGDEVIYKSCDIFIPAFKECVVTVENLHKFKFKIIVEAAFCALTYEAEQAILKEKKNPILVIPDILAGGGSLIAAVFEIYKDQTRQGNPMESVEGITGSYKMILDIFKNNGINFSNIEDVKEKWNDSLDLQTNLLKNAIEGNIRPILHQIDEVISNSEDDITLRMAAYSLVFKKLKEFYRTAGFTI